MKERIKTEPVAVFSEYRRGTDFKAGIGSKGIFEQSKINERFYAGDHWHGAKCGNDRPLVRRNIIRRIADYKLSSIGSAPIAVNFSAEGVPDCGVNPDERRAAYDAVTSGNTGFDSVGEADELEISIIMQFLTDYGQSTMERLRLTPLAPKCYTMLMFRVREYFIPTGMSLYRRGFMRMPQKTPP